MDAAVRAALGRAAETNDSSLLLTAAACLDQDPAPALELLVLCAETALQVGELNAAEQALESYNLQAKRFVAAGEAPVESKDQYVCRAAFARALLVAERANDLKARQTRRAPISVMFTDAVIRGQGPERTTAVLAAIKLVLEGIALAQANDRHTFLVYNGSVHYWRVSRPLQRDGARSVLLPSLEAILKALDKVPAQEEWKVRNMMNLAMCQLEAGALPAAVTTATTAVELAKAAAPDLLPSAVALKVHLTNCDPRARTPGSGASPAAPAAAAPPAAAAKKGDPPPKKGPVATPSMGEDPGMVSAAALAVAQAVRTQALTPAAGGPSGALVATAPDRAVVERTIADAWARVDPAGASRPVDPASITGIDLAAVAELAWAAAVAGATEVAAAAAARAAQSKSLPPRLRAQLTAELLASAALPSGLRADAVAARAATLSRLEPVLAAFLRLGDAEGVQDAARLAWSTALPLLQMNLRGRTVRLLSAAASALESIGSPLHALRASLHCEVAGAYAAEDLLAKAAVAAAKGRALDYAAPVEEVAWTGLPRPLDRHLVPLHRALALRTALYDEPGGAEDAAVLLIEKAKEAGDASVRANYLAQAVAKLETLADPAAALSAALGPAAHPGGVAMTGPPPPPLGGATDGGDVKGDNKGGDKDKDKDKGAKGGRAKTPPGGGTKPSATAAATEADVPALTPEQLELRLAAKTRTVLWGEAAKAARTAGLWSVAHGVAPRVLSAPRVDATGRGIDRDVAQLQAEIAFVDAEACIMLLRSRGVAPQPPPPDGWDAVIAGCTAAGDDDGAETASLQLRAMGGFHQGLAIGASVGQPWLVANGAAYLWNHWLPYAVAQRYAGLVPVLLPAALALLALPGADVTATSAPGADAQALYALAHATACGLEHRVLIARAAVAAVTAGASPPSEDYKTLLAGGVTAPPTLPAGDAAVKEASDLALGADICRRAAARVAPAQRRRLVAALARLMALAGSPVTGADAAKALDPLPAGQAVALVELLSKPEVAPARKLEALTAARALLSGVTPPDVELWAKLAQGALSLGQPAAAMECAASALALVPPGVASTPSDVAFGNAPPLPAESWYWMALAAAACGQGTEALLDPGKQTLGTRDALRRQAMGHFVHAVRCGARAGRRDVVEWALRLYWNAALEDMATPEARAVLLPALEELLARALEVGVGDATAPIGGGATAGGGPLEPGAEAQQLLLNARAQSQLLLAALYALALDCLVDAQRWLDGSALIEAAFGYLPRPFHKPLWEFKVLFLTKMGRAGALRDELAAIGDYSPELQARVWSALAASTTSQHDALEAHLSAARAVETQPVHHAEALLDMADFMQRAKLPSADACDAIITAIEEVTALEDVGSDGLSRESSAAPLPRAVRSQHAQSPPGGERRGSATHAGPVPRREASMLSLGDGGGVPQVAGEPSVVTTNTSMISIWGCRHLRVLIRAYLMLAQSATSGRRRVDALLLAHHAAVRLLRAALLAANARPAEPAATAPAAPVAPAVPVPPPGKGAPPPAAVAESSADALAAAQAAAAAAAAEKTIPDGLEAWAAWLPPASVVSSLMADDSTDALTHDNTGRPDILLSHLQYLVDGLTDAGLDLHALPILHLCGLVSTVSLQSMPATCVYGLRLAALLDRLGLPVESTAAAAAATPGGVMLLSPAEAAAHADEVDQRNALTAGQASNDGDRDAAVPGRVSIFSLAAAPTGAPAGVGRRTGRFAATLQAAVRRASVGGVLSGGAASPGVDGADVVTVNAPTAIRHAWLARAEHLLSRGLVQQARVLLKAALAHATAFRDRPSSARCLLHLAKCAQLSNDPTAAIGLCYRAAAVGGELRSLWSSLLPLWADCQCASRDGRMAAREGLESAATALRGLESSGRADAVPEARRTRAVVCRSLAALHSGDAAALAATGAAPADVARLHAAAAGAHNDALAALRSGAGTWAACAVACVGLADALTLALPPPTPGMDRRPQLAAIGAALEAARVDLMSILSHARPPQLASYPIFPCLPVQRQLADVKARLARNELDRAIAAEAAAPADRAALRPHVIGCPPPTDDAGGDAALAEFLDSALGPLPPIPREHEEAAILHATTAVALGPPPARRAALLRTLGLALLRQHERLAAESGALSVWVRAPEPTVGDGGTPAEQPKYRDRGLGKIMARPDSGRRARPRTPPKKTATSPSASRPVSASFAKAAPPKPGSRPPSAKGKGLRPGSSKLKLGGSPSPAVVVTSAAPPDLAATPYLDQVVSELQGALAAGLSDGDYSIAGAAAEDLATLWGRSNAMASSHMTLLAQSCRAQAVLRGIYINAAGPDETDKLLLVQRDHAVSSLVSSPPPDPLDNGGNPELWKLLSCTAPVDGMLALLPPDSRTAALHVTADGRWLFLAINWPAVPDQVDVKHPVTGSPAGAHVDRMPLDAVALERLLAAAADYARLADKTLLNARPVAAGVATLPSGGYLDAALGDGWSALCAAQDAFFKPFAHALASACTLVDAEGFSIGRRMILLPDPTLAPLPLEALPCLSAAAWVCRDFSVHVLGGRLEAFITEPHDAKEHLLKASFHAVVDLRCEDREPTPPEVRLPPGRRAAPLLVAAQKSVLDVFGRAWPPGLAGSVEAVPGCGEVGRLLAKARALMYLGLGRFLAYVPPVALCGLRLKGLQLALLLDRANNEATDRRQAYLDNRKAPAELALESPYATAALLTLRGVRCVAVNTLAATVESNLYLATRLCKAMGQGGTLGEALRAAAQVEADQELPTGGMPPYTPHNLVVYGPPLRHVAADDGKPVTPPAAAKEKPAAGKAPPPPAKKK